MVVVESSKDNFALYAFDPFYKYVNDDLDDFFQYYILCHENEDNKEKIEDFFSELEEQHEIISVISSTNAFEKTLYKNDNNITLDTLMLSYRRFSSKVDEIYHKHFDNINRDMSLNIAWATIITYLEIFN